MPYSPAFSAPVREPDFFPAEPLLALEQVEATFYRDLYKAASPAALQAADLRHRSVGSGQVFLAPEADVLALNKVLALGLRSPVQEKDLDRIIQVYREAGVRRFFLQMSPAVLSPLLHQWLSDYGFRHHNNWTKLFRPLDEPVPIIKTNFRIERIGRAEAEAFGQMVAPAFDWPDRLAAALAGTVGRPGWQHYFAFEGDVPAATAACFMHEGYVYLGPAVTREAYRRRGAQRALIARRLQDAVAMGCHTAITDTAEERPDKPVPSYRNMRHMGFNPAYARPNYLFTF